MKCFKMFGSLIPKIVVSAFFSKRKLQVGRMVGTGDVTAWNAVKLWNTKKSKEVDFFPPPPPCLICVAIITLESKVK